MNTDSKRRASDRRLSERRGLVRRLSDGLRTGVSWEDQRSQYITRYLLWALGIAYFALGDSVARGPGAARLLQVMFPLYFVVITTLFVLGWRKPFAAWRWRSAMWADLIGVGSCLFADSVLTSPVYLVFLAIVFGNGLRYGQRAFVESILGAFTVGAVVAALRFGEYLAALTPAAVLFILLVIIVILYSYALMERVERNRQRLEAESTVDVLTGLLNRRGLEERALRVMESSQRHDSPVALLFADLDGFKAVNDGQGHHVGDRVLRQIAALVLANIRATDVAARYGGDEFVVLMPDTALDEALRAAQRLQQAMDHWSRSGDTSLSFSIGLGIAPQHASTFEDLVRCVDQAMYRCKQQFGRGGIQVAEAGLSDAQP